MIVVSDIEKSKMWYHDILGLNVVSDFGTNVLLTGGVSLQEKNCWKQFIGGKEVVFGNNAYELYFEENDIDNFFERLDSYSVEYVHSVVEHRWGQRVVRFYDLDKHIIEVGENMAAVVHRFFDRRMTEEKIASRMDVPLEYVKKMLEQS